MAGLGINVAANIGNARAILTKARELAVHPRALMEIAGGLLEESTRYRFATSRGPGGLPWPPSGRQRYAARPGGGKGRSAMGPNPGGRTLIDSGGLLSSITHIADDNRVEVGVIAKTPSAKFAYVHQYGATIRPRRAKLAFRGPDGHLIFASFVVIPARPFIGVDAMDRADLIEAWNAFLEAYLLSIDLKACRDRAAELELFHFISDVVGAADAIENFGGNPPALFVSTASERAGAEQLRTIGCHRQKVVQTVSLLFVLGAERADEERNDDMEEKRMALIDSFVAWTPPGADGAFAYQGFSVRNIADGLIWGEVLVAAPWHLVKA